MCHDYKFNTQSNHHFLNFHTPHTNVKKRKAFEVITSNFYIKKIDDIEGCVTQLMHNYFVHRKETPSIPSGGDHTCRIETLIYIYFGCYVNKGLNYFTKS